MGTSFLVADVHVHMYAALQTPLALQGAMLTC